MGPQAARREHRGSAVARRAELDILLFNEAAVDRELLATRHRHHAADAPILEPAARTLRQGSRWKDRERTSEDRESETRAQQPGRHGISCVEGDLL